MHAEDMSPDLDADTPAAENEHDETAEAAAPAEDASFEAHSGDDEDGDDEMDVADDDEMDAEDDDASTDQA
jgi:hypothetical protein